ncbi:unnamed protein product [Acanthoscelides obtectus]|uniref:Uncharacterized protein n=1 Tax=Acanthoscelides obtectus TaxID=200917 RepID=A0A9P0KAT3_ACAOB|nr:unnamed protein product [Acanthoscelides obtectus]CAK1645561.1 hypothetical protein AOBTE_LOCUS14146 [Acanthoscelides obtectus]
MSTFRQPVMRPCMSALLNGRDSRILETRLETLTAIYQFRGRIEFLLENAGVHREPSVDHINIRPDGSHSGDRQTHGNKMK